MTVRWSAGPQLVVEQHGTCARGDSPLACISVITITWNDLDGIKKAFASLREQTYADVEHIIIDGGSTDGSVEWIACHPAFPRSTFLSEPDNGIYDAMNKGLALATGDIVYFLNAGDQLNSPDVLASVDRSFSKNRWEWAVGASQMVDQNNVAVRKKMRPGYQWWVRTFMRYNLSQQAIFIRRDVLQNVGGFDRRYSIAGDYHLITNLGRHYEPEILQIHIANTLEGGVSDRRLGAAHLEAHKARVDILSLGVGMRFLDALWTGVLIVEVWTRRLTRRVLRIIRQVSLSSRHGSRD